MARAAPAKTTRAPSSRSPTTATSSTTWPAGSSSSTAAAASRMKGNYSSYLEKKAGRLGVEEEKDEPSCQAPLTARSSRWVRTGPARPPGQEQGPPRAAYEELAAEADKTRKLDFEELHIPPPPRLGHHSWSRRGPRQGLRRPTADQGPVLHAAAQRHRRRHRPQRRRQDHAVQDDRRPGAAGQRRRQGRRDRQPGLRRPEPRRHRPQQDRLAGGLRRPGLHRGRPERDPVARLRGGVRIQGPRSAEAGGRAVRR